MRIGYGKLTIYLGAAAGSGKTYAMLDRAHNCEPTASTSSAALVETHGRAETERCSKGSRCFRTADHRDGIANGELDREAIDRAPARRSR